MVFGIIILLENMFKNVVANLSLVQPQIISPPHGGAVIYWFTPAGHTGRGHGAYRAVVFIKNNIKLDSTQASIEDSKKVVRICTVYAQKGMWNIFIVIFSLPWPCRSSILFLHRLPDGHSLLRSLSGNLMPTPWRMDNAKKVVELT